MRFERADGEHRIQRSPIDPSESWTIRRMKIILPLVAAALLVPGLANSASVVTLQCKLKIVKADFVETPATKKTFDENVEVNVRTYDKDTFSIEINGAEFSDRMLSNGVTGSKGTATPDEWRVERKTASASSSGEITSTLNISISRRSGRLEYQKIQWLERERATSMDASGSCAKNDTSKRKF